MQWFSHSCVFSLMLPRRILHVCRCFVNRLHFYLAAAYRSLCFCYITQRSCPLMPKTYLLQYKLYNYISTGWFVQQHKIYYTAHPQSNKSMVLSSVVSTSALWSWIIQQQPVHLLCRWWRVRWELAKSTVRHITRSVRTLGSRLTPPSGFTPIWAPGG